MHGLHETSAHGRDEAGAGSAALPSLAFAASPMSAAFEYQNKSGADPSALIAAIAARRCRQSFAELFTAFAPRVKSYMIRLGARPEQAEELAQEALLAVWRKADYFDPSRASASTWIFTIARNLRIDAIRRERRPDDLLDDPSMAPFEQPTADDILAAGERDGQLRAALTALPNDQAEVVRLSFFMDKAHSEISQALGVPLGTVKSRLRLAMNRLRAALEERA